MLHYVYFYVVFQQVDKLEKSKTYNSSLIISIFCWLYIFLTMDCNTELSIVLDKLFAIVVPYLTSLFSNEFFKEFYAKLSCFNIDNFKYNYCKSNFSYWHSEMKLLICYNFRKLSAEMSYRLTGILLKIREREFSFWRHCILIT